MHYKKYKTILSESNGINIYRGCSHGCIYCDSRSKCYHIEHAFEDVEIKEDAYIMLDYELYNLKEQIMIGTGSMSDPYIPIEKTIQHTRKCLEVIEKYNCGVSIQTKSDLILRDIDILKRINEKAKAVVEMTLTTASDNLCRIIEPNVAVTSKRVEVLKRMHEEGIPTVVWLCPILPYINDSEENIIKLLDYCSEAHVYGIIFFGAGLTLRDLNRDYYYECLDKYFVGLRKIYEEKYGLSYEVNSIDNERLCRLVKQECKKRNIICDNDELFKFLRTYPKSSEQLKLF